jgi:hypothetical protein
LQEYALGLADCQCWKRKLGSAALHDGSMEQSRSAGRRQVGQDAQPAGGLPENGDFVRVTAERNDVSLHPLQCELLIHDPVVTRSMIGRFGRQCRMREKPQGAQAVVDRHDDHVAGGRQHAPIEVIALPEGQGASMDPHHDGTQMRRFALLRIIIVGMRHIHVQEQAIFAGARGTGRVGALGAMAAKLRRIQNVRPRSVNLRRLPPQIPDRRGRIRDAKKLADI